MPGFKLKPTTKKIEKADEELKKQLAGPTAAEETVSTEASPVTTKTREMFKETAADKGQKKATAAPSVIFPTAVKPKPLAKPSEPLAKPSEPLAKPSEPLAKPTEPSVEAKPVARKEAELVSPFEEVDFSTIPEGENRDIAKEYIEQEKVNPYTNPATNEVLNPPAEYLTENNRGFIDFIKMTYDDFSLKPIGEAAPVAPGDKYPYQKFIREYMREASPYRGVLVYHGLGSGKTCTAIAASEALFSTANKKIVVMTPFSLRKNFLSEISFCGFRHFHLKNHWVSYEKDDALFQLFAKQILNLSDNYLRTAKKIWIPDLTKGPEEANYDSIPEEGKKEIRKQILAQLIWDKSTNPTGRIRFINYNGISAKALRELACKEGPLYNEFFDDAVIVVDEIHNLVRLMQGDIDPYLSLIKSDKPVKRRIQLEKVLPGHWKPTLCDSPKNYKRGYLFYRLLLGAQRSKIIGLSGTPLINFPEELGILANVLHGYIHTLSGTLVGTVNNAAVETLLKNHLYFDYVGIQNNEFIVSLLPEGVRKIANSSGVERIPRAETLPTLDEIKDSLAKSLKDNGYKVSGEILVKSLPLLPPFGEEFRTLFLNPEKIGLRNEILLSKRLTGLISYYKGSRLDLMPRIAKDEIVRCPFSQYAQDAYTVWRSAEIAKEEKKKTGTGLGGAWTEVYDLGDKKETSSYRINSRQVCNFAFPPSVTRPEPKSKADRLMDTEGQRDIPDTAPGLIIPEEEKYALTIDDKEEIDEDASTVGDDEEEEEEEEEEEKKEEKEEQKGFSKQYEVLVALQKLLDKFAEDDIDIFGELEKEENGVEYYKLKVPISEEDLRLLDAEFTSMKFHPEGFEISADPDQKSNEFEYLTVLFERATDAAKKALEEEEEKKKAAKKEVGVKVKPRVKGVSFSPNTKKGGANSNNNDSTASSQSTSDSESNSNNNSTASSQSSSDSNSNSNSDSDSENEKATAKPVVEKKSLQQLLAERQAKKVAEISSLQCKGVVAGESYLDAQLRAKACLREKVPDTLAMNAEGLGKYSSKYLAMLENIRDAPGSSLVYSAFLSMEGLGIFQIAMELAGYVPIIIEPIGGSFRFSTKTIASLRKGPGAEPRYMTFSGGELDDVRKLSLNIFNANFEALPAAMKNELKRYTDNKTGQLCRVFCITSAGAEGLSLKNVRAVHIMEPHWNDVRLTQVKGRAIRLGSHLDLPEDQRDVSIYTYVSVFGDEAQKAKSGALRIDENIRKKDGDIAVKALKEVGMKIPDGLVSYVMTSDEHLLRISLQKKKVIEELQKLMKGVAIDCQLNMAENKDGTYQCFSLKGNVGDFLYHPDITIDKTKTESEYKFKKVEVRKGFSVRIKDVSYQATEVRDDTDILTGFELYDPTDLDYKQLLGITKARNGKPVRPFELY